MSLSEGGSGWSNPYTAEYEALISSLETTAIGNFNEINRIINSGLSAEQSGANSYQALAAPETWSAMAIDPLNALCAKLNRDFLDTVAYRTGKLIEARIVNPNLDFKA